jgi:protein phosphatase PTC7
MRFELGVQPGDVVVCGTDGLWDNVFAEEAATIVARCKAQGDGPEAAANTLCRCAGGRVWR